MFLLKALTNKLRHFLHNMFFDFAVDRNQNLIHFFQKMNSRRVHSNYEERSIRCYY